jgi:hypothetical protein
MLQRLELLGRCEFDCRSGLDSNEIRSTCAYPFVQDFVQNQDADRDGFLTDLHALVATDRGGFATFGAAWLAWELCGDEALETPAAWPLIDAGIEFKRARSLPMASLTVDEKLRLARRHGVDVADLMSLTGEIDISSLSSKKSEPTDSSG